MDHTSNTRPRPPRDNETAASNQPTSAPSRCRVRRKKITGVPPRGRTREKERSMTRLGPISARIKRIPRRPGLGLAACATLVLVGACGSAESSKAGTFFSSPQGMGNGVVGSYVTLDTAGNPTDVGVRMTATALDGLPEKDTAPPKMTTLELPEQASSTAFNHVMLNWNSQGHRPEMLFGKPHFDIHFYMTDTAAVMAIAPGSPDFEARGAHLPEPRYVPKDYVPDPGPPADRMVPAMGLHWLDGSEGLVPGKYDFKNTFINGSWDGKYTFMEPMMTREWLLTKAPLRQDIKQPAAYQRSGYFPTVYSVNFDDSSNEYVISLGGLTKRNAS